MVARAACNAYGDTQPMVAIGDEMEFGNIERWVEIDAAPATVFEVITSSEHLRQWWPDDAAIEPVPGAVGHLVFGDRTSGDAHVPQITIVDVDPPRLFSFRWVYPDDETACEGNSLHVVFELTEVANGTRLRMIETGFREKGWEVAMLEDEYRKHVAGWDRFLPRLAKYAPTVRVSS